MMACAGITDNTGWGCRGVLLLGRSSLAFLVSSDYRVILDPLPKASLQATYCLTFVKFIIW